MASYDVKVITSAQLRAARALLGWSARELAEYARLSEATISRAERQPGPITGLTAANVAALQRAVVDAGVTFLEEDDAGGPGVRLVKGF